MRADCARPWTAIPSGSAVGNWGAEESEAPQADDYSGEGIPHLQMCICSLGEHGPDQDVQA